jgi:hypothetical protein
MVIANYTTSCWLSADLLQEGTSDQELGSFLRSSCQLRRNNTSSNNSSSSSSMWESSELLPQSRQLTLHQLAAYLRPGSSEAEFQLGWPGMSCRLSARRWHR